MTDTQEKAVTLIKTLPDDKLEFVIEILHGIKGLSVQVDSNTIDLQKRRHAWENLQKFRGKIPPNLNYDDELAQSRNERYGNIN